MAIQYYRMTVLKILFSFLITDVQASADEIGFITYMSEARSVKCIPIDLPGIYCSFSEKYPITSKDIFLPDIPNFGSSEVTFQTRATGPFRGTCSMHLPSAEMAISHECYDAKARLEGPQSERQFLYYLAQITFLAKGVDGKGKCKKDSPILLDHSAFNRVLYSKKDSDLDCKKKKATSEGAAEH